jgi:predicted alpha-1,2-mannosidase
VLLLTSLFLACSPTPAEDLVTTDDWVAGDEFELVDLINPFIGTGGTGYGVGGSYPGAGRPFGLVKVSPDTSDKYDIAHGYSHTGGYHYGDDHIRAFSHMHMQGVGIAAYGALGLMPLDGFVPDDAFTERRKQRFAHDDEQAEAGYYAVTFAEQDISVQLSATEHTALHEYTFGEVEQPTVLVDLAHVIGKGSVHGGEVTIDAEGGLVEGWLVMDGEMGAPYPLFFSILFDTLPTGFGTWTGDIALPGWTTASKILPEPLEDGSWGDVPNVPLGAWLHFDGADVVRARVAVSNVDLDGARANLDAEHTGFSMDDERAAARAAWQAQLSPIRAWGGSERDQIIFASSAFKSLQMPTLFSDVDGRYRAFDGEIKVADWGRFYTDFSLWDTYRSTHPLYILLWKEETADMCDSLAAMVRDGGSIPRWPLANWDGGAMLGTPGTIVFTEAYLKGITDFDVETLRQAALGIADGSLVPEYGGRPDVAQYDQYGYHPADDIGRGVAWTQELAISDALLGTLESALGDETTAAMLLERAGWWENHFNPATGYFHARLADGSFVPIDDVAVWDDAYTEGNARQYRWLVPHDPEGLFRAMGGEEVAVGYLTELFEGRREELEDLGEIGVPSSWYWHGNEPDIHAAFLFAAAGRPDLTRQWVHWILDNEYDNSPGGIDGNDDGGTLAAWFVFAAAGLYPLNGTDRYILADPRFDRIELDVGAPGEPPFTIERRGDGEIVRIELDGVVLEDTELRHSDLRPGSTLAFIAE